MNCVVVSNDTALSSAYQGEETEVEAEHDAPGRWTQGAASRTFVLSRVEHELIRAFSSIDAVNALYAERDDENVLMVFVVVPEHDDSVYQQVVAAEHLVRSRLSDDFELRVRAHQGRNPIRAVPIRSLPLFLK